MDDELLTTNQVAAIFNTAPSSVTRWVREGRMRAIKTPGGKTLRIKRSEVDRFLAGDDSAVATTA